MHALHTHFYSLSRISFIPQSNSRRRTAWFMRMRRFWIRTDLGDSGFERYPLQNESRRSNRAADPSQSSTERRLLSAERGFSFRRLWLFLRRRYFLWLRCILQSWTVDSSRVIKAEWVVRWYDPTASSTFAHRSDLGFLIRLLLRRVGRNFHSRSSGAPHRTTERNRNAPRAHVSGGRCILRNPDSTKHSPRRAVDGLFDLPDRRASFRNARSSTDVHL